MRWDGHRESTDIDLLIGANAVTTLWEMVVNWSLLSTN